jgi:hypothetical protein
VTAAALQLPKRVAATPKTGRGVVEAACALSTGETCRVSLVATIGKTSRKRRTKARRVGTIAGTVPGGQTATLTLRLNHTGVQTLRRKKRLSASLSGTVRGAGGSAKISRRLGVDS